MRSGAVPVVMSAKAAMRVGSVDGDLPTARKARGAFFTPPEICDFICSWALRSKHDSVFEPSCGEAAFLVSSAQRLQSLGAKPHQTQLSGAELHADSAAIARNRVRSTGFVPDIHVGDFFNVTTNHLYDCVLGNPPFVRYQAFAGNARDAGKRAAGAQGVELSGLANSWAAFVIHAVSFLSDSGRLGLVLPAELLSANFAAPVRTFLLERFADVTVVLFEEQVFPGVLTEGLLLLAEGTGGTDHITVQSVRNPSALQGDSVANSVSWSPDPTQSRWTNVLAAGDAAALIEPAMSSEFFGPLGNWGRASLGAVTGNNGFFCLSDDDVDRLGLENTDLVNISPPGSKHLRTIRFTKSDYDCCGEAGLRIYLFTPIDPSRAAEQYIKAGRKLGVHTGFKCRTREPWWRPPVVPIPDMLLTYMNSDTPRLATNEAGVHHINSVHGLFMKKGLDKLKIELAVASLNSISMLGAELVGRAYGGGILKLEPREAMQWPMPSVATVRAVRQELRQALPKVTELIRENRLRDAAAFVDSILLDAPTAIDVDIEAVRVAQSGLARRRAVRGSGKTGPT